MPEGRARRPAADDKTNVQDVASSFVGRAQDIAAIAACFVDARLVTVTGPGGMGKTRLAIRFAQRHVDDFAAHGGGGAWFCDCTPARNAEGVLSIVAGAIGAPLGRSEEAAKEVGAAIARKGRVLVVLDNFEHLTSFAAETVGVWLRRAPHARILVTSRVALGVPGEVLWPLGPLEPPEAVDLFVGRARAVRPDLEVGDRERALALEVVAALDHMPLAIELAASRVSVLSPAQLLERLRRPLDVLTRANDGGRHTSMRRAVLDSVALLSAEERDAFAACAIFRAGFALEAAEAILSPADALAAIDALVRHSLVRATAARGLAPSDDVRFSLFETIREVSSELLAAHAHRDLVGARHQAYYADLVPRLGAQAATQSGGPAFVRLGLELENALSAHAHAVAEAARDPGARGAGDAAAIALGLEPLLSARGLSRLRTRLLDEALAGLRRPGAPAAQEVVAELLLARGLARRELADMQAARADFEEALAIAGRHGRADLSALAHARIGEIIEVTGDTAAAHARFVRALELLERGPDDSLRALREAETMMRIGHAHRREGRLPRAEEAIDQAIVRYRRLGHDEGLAAALYEAAVVAMFQGRHDASLARFDEGLVVAERAGARAVAGALTTARGGLLQERGALDLALAHHAEAARVFRELGSRYRETSALYYLATAYLERGDASEADKVLLQAMDCVQGVGSPRYEALIQGCRAVALALQGDAAAARASYDSALRALSRCPTEGALATTLALHGASLDARLLGTDAATGDDSLSRATERVARDPSDDSRFALRMLLSIARPSPRAPSAALVIGPAGRFFRLPGAPHETDLSRRPPLGRILAALAEARCDSPGQPVAVEEIVRAGWPGEKMAAHAALNRARVALATLRKLGLRDLLVTGTGGYWLHPATSVRLARQSEPTSIPRA